MVVQGRVKLQQQQIQTQQQELSEAKQEARQAKAELQAALQALDSLKMTQVSDHMKVSKPSHHGLLLMYYQCASIEQSSFLLSSCKARPNCCSLGQRLSHASPALHPCMAGQRDSRGACCGASCMAWAVSVIMWLSFWQWLP